MYRGLIKNYDWIVRILEYEFPKARVISSEYDCGWCLGIGVAIGDKRRAVAIKNNFCDINKIPIEEQELFVAKVLADIHEKVDPKGRV